MMKMSLVLSIQIGCQIINIQGGQIGIFHYFIFDYEQLKLLTKTKLPSLITTKKIVTMISLLKKQ